MMEEVNKLDLAIKRMRRMERVAVDVVVRVVVDTDAEDMDQILDALSTHNMPFIEVASAGDFYYSAKSVAAVAVEVEESDAQATFSD